MTVIAYNHKSREIAVDSLVTASSVVCGEVRKFVTLPDGSIGFGCGSWPAVMMLFDAWSSGNTPDESKYEDATIIVVRQGVVYEYECPIPSTINRSWAWGSGAEFALGALYSGASATDAAKIAARFSTSCGGKVHTFKTR